MINESWYFEIYSLLLFIFLEETVQFQMKVTPPMTFEMTWVLLEHLSLKFQLYDLSFNECRNSFLGL
jgi:hypothetical protein